MNTEIARVENIIITPEEKRNVIISGGLNELLAEYNIGIDLLDVDNTEYNIDYTIEDLENELKASEHIGWYTLTDEFITLHTERLEEKGKYLVVGSTVTNIVDVNAKPDQDIIDFITNYEDKDKLVIKALTGVKFADLVFDHVLSTGFVPVADSIILFRNYCFVTKPFLASFEEEKEFLKKFGEGIKITEYPHFFIKDY